MYNSVESALAISSHFNSCLRGEKYYACYKGVGLTLNYKGQVCFLEVSLKLARV